jgi:hypothetical protein
MNNIKSKIHIEWIERKIGNVMYSTVKFVYVDMSRKEKCESFFDDKLYIIPSELKWTLMK